MKKIVLTLSLFIIFTLNGVGQSNFLYYTLKGYTGKTAVLFSIKGGQNIPIDTVGRQQSGAFVFTHTERYPVGMYRVYFNDSLYTELIINNENIMIESDTRNIIKSMHVKQSIENKILFDYWKFAFEVKDSIMVLSRKKTSLEQKLRDPYHPEIIKIKEKIELYNDAMYLYVKQELDTKPQFFAPKLLMSYIVPSMKRYNKENPDSIYNNEEEFYYEHFFDNVDFSDARFVNTKVFFVSVSDYMQTFGQAATTENYIGIINQVMTKAQANKEVYTYCLDMFIQAFENSIWEDVLVHLIDNYYSHPHVEAHYTKRYYMELSSRIKALKIGRLAPNIVAQSPEGKTINLHSSQAKAKMLVFFSSDCSHCRKALPSLIEVYNMYKGRGFETFAFAIDDDIKLWKDEIAKFNMEWTNLSDLKSMASPYIETYNIKSTPTIILLDKNNIIISKPKNIDDIHMILSELLN